MYLSCLADAVATRKYQLITGTPTRNSQNQLVTRKIPWPQMNHIVTILYVTFRKQVTSAFLSIWKINIPLPQYLMTCLACHTYEPIDTRPHKSTWHSLKLLLDPLLMKQFMTNLFYKESTIGKFPWWPFLGFYGKVPIMWIITEQIICQKLSSTDKITK